VTLSTDVLILTFTWTSNTGQLRASDVICGRNCYCHSLWNFHNGWTTPGGGI
jgi:hypothetical protein